MRWGPGLGGGAALGDEADWAGLVCVCVFGGAVPPHTHTNTHNPPQSPALSDRRGVYNRRLYTDGYNRRLYTDGYNRRLYKWGAGLGGGAALGDEAEDYNRL